MSHLLTGFFCNSMYTLGDITAMPSRSRCCWWASDQLVSVVSQCLYSQIFQASVELTSCCNAELTESWKILLEWQNDVPVRRIASSKEQHTILLSTLTIFISVEICLVYWCRVHAAMMSVTLGELFQEDLPCAWVCYRCLPVCIGIDLNTSNRMRDPWQTMHHKDQAVHHCQHVSKT